MSRGLRVVCAPGCWLCKHVSNRAAKGARTVPINGTIASRHPATQQIFDSATRSSTHPEARIPSASSACSFSVSSHVPGGSERRNASRISGGIARNACA